MKRLLAALVSVLLVGVGAPAWADAPSVTASIVSPQPVGTVASIKGTVKGAVNVPVVAERLVGSKWTAVSNATAGAKGSYVLRLSDVTTNQAGKFTYRVRATVNRAQVVSPNVTLTRTAKVTVSAPEATGPRTTAKVTGKVAGVAKGSVWTEVKVSGTWQRARSVSSDAKGVFSIPLTHNSGRADSIEYRVAANSPNGVVYSSAFKVDQVGSVTAQTAGSRPVGVATNVWGVAAGSPNAKVWVDALVGGKWSRSRAGKTTSKGGYVLPLTYGINAAGVHKYRVGVASPAGTIYSPTVTLERVGSITASTAGRRPVGVKTSVWGTAKGYPNRTVWVDVKLSNGKWSRSQTGKTSSSGYYALPLTYGAKTPGRYQFRVGVSGPAGTKYSKTVILERTHPTYQQGFRLDSRCMTGRAFCASKEQRKIAWVINGKVVEVADARFGGPGMETDNGSWRITWKSRNHVSKQYNSPMPFAMFFNGGEAIHYSPGFASNGWNGASHGCINMRDYKASERYFNAGRVGDKVIVY